MKIFFRKHGSVIFYIGLPVFFLILTIALIQFTPRESVSQVGANCSDAEECCNNSGCGAAVGQACGFSGRCLRTNVGCPDGEEIDDMGPGDCVCVEGGVVVGDCTECPVNQVFLDGRCVNLCDSDDDFRTTNCVGLQGSGPIAGSGTGAPAGGGNLASEDFGAEGCSLNPALASSGLGSLLALLAFLLAPLLGKLRRFTR